MKSAVWNRRRYNLAGDGPPGAGLPRLHHVQITAPRDREREARRFYGKVLGLPELDRARTIPATGLWFAFDRGLELHVVLVDNPLRPPLGDHFAFVVDDMEAVKKRLADHRMSYQPSPSQQNGYERIFVQDPFGNRIELLGPSNGGVAR